MGCGYDNVVFEYVVMMSYLYRCDVHVIPCGTDATLMRYRCDIDDITVFSLFSLGFLVLFNPGRAQKSDRKDFD